MKSNALRVSRLGKLAVMVSYAWGARRKREHQLPGSRVCLNQQVSVALAAPSVAAQDSEGRPCSFEGPRAPVWGTRGGRTLLNEPLCVCVGSGWTVVSKGAWAQIKTRFISLAVDRGGF